MLHNLTKYKSQQKQSTMLFSTALCASFLPPLCERTRELTPPAATVAWGRSACTLPCWKSRWSRRSPPGRRSVPRDPAIGSGAECSKTGWSGRPWGGPGQTGPRSFQPETRHFGQRSKDARRSVTRRNYTRQKRK